jgi:dienelactone hydrolase
MGGSDPGRIFVLQRPENLALEILRRAPWLSAAKLNDTRYFEFAAPDGARLSGYLTWPKTPRRSPPPLLAVLPPELPGGPHLPFDPEAEIFADLGFAVARLNHRVPAGNGAENPTAQRVADERDLIGDVGTTLERMAAHLPDRPFDRRRVAVLGRNNGGYLALRAMELEPAAFRCGIAIDAALDLRSGLPPAGTPAPEAPPGAGRSVPVALFEPASAEGKTRALLDHAEALVNPVLLLVEPGRNPATDAATEALRARLQALGRPPEQLELEPGFAAVRPPARALVYRKIEEFLSRHLDGYNVKIGPAREVE